jgi:hypothetical protein
MHRAVGAVVAVAAAVALAAPAVARAEWQRGVDYTTYAATTYGSPASDSSLARLAADGNSNVAIVVTRYMQSTTASSIIATPRTPTDASILHAVQTARSLGLAVTLKPQVDVLPSGWVGTVTPADPAAWFDSLQATIYHYADLAQQGGAAMLVVGTEMQSMSGPAYTARWQQLIAGVRQRFSGRLTYASNFDEFQQVQFWPSLDYIGVDGYWRLSNVADPSLESLLSAWASTGHVTALRQASLAVGKPVLLTEIGYRSVAGATIHPNLWSTTGALDLTEQANAYEAAYRTFAGQPWIAGLYWWSWPATLPPDGSNTDYTPTFKPAEQVMQSWNAKLSAVGAPAAPVAPSPAPAPTSKPVSTPKRHTRRKCVCRVRTGASRRGRRCKGARAHRKTRHAARRSRGGR